MFVHGRRAGEMSMKPLKSLVTTKILSMSIAIIAVLSGAWNTPAQAQTKLVFAHYLVANQSYGNGYNFDYVAGYMKEIQQAQAIGIDGFALNVGGWSGQPAYITWCTQIF